MNDVTPESVEGTTVTAAPRLMIAAKLNPPLASPFEVARSQLCDQIFSAGGARLVLIRAAAGFGKTTVMRQVRQGCESSGLASAWLTLDTADNDVGRLLAGLAAALENVFVDGPRDISQASSPAPLLHHSAVDLIDRISTHPRPFVLFLDEFEVVHSATVLSLVRQIIDHLPVGAQLVIGSRTIPALALGRLRARGSLLDIEPSQLRFTEVEARDFLLDRRNLRLSVQEVARLFQRTEGWAAALWLASLALDHRDSPAALIDNFSGSDSAIADYLAEDVLARQPSDIREFLLRTSILGDFNVSLCDALWPAGGSRELLDRLERAHLFLIPLDKERLNYRYHSLFSEFLRARLNSEFPQDVPELHRAASQWYQAQGRHVPAIEHAFASGQMSYALPLLERHAVQLLTDARMRLLARWLGSVSPDALAGYPKLRIVHAWAMNFTQGPRESMKLIQAIGEQPSLDDESTAYLLALPPILLSLMDRSQEAYVLGQANLGRMALHSGFARGMLANSLATDCMVAGRLGEAKEYLDEVRRAQVPFGVTFSVALAESLEGAIDLLRGQLRQATARLRTALQPAQDAEPNQYVRPNALAGVLLAEALYEANECDQAERLLSMYVPLIKDGGLPDQLISGHVLLSRIVGSRGDFDQAFQLITELEHLGYRLELPRVLASVKLERARVALARGDFSSAREELDSAADGALWERVARSWMVANDVETFDIGRLRWMIRVGKSAEALPLLAQQLALAEHDKRVRRSLKLRILTAEALHGVGQHKAATQAIGTALALAGHEGFVRTFVDEGAVVAGLIREWASMNSPSASRDHGVPRAFVERLVQALGQATDVAETKSTNSPQTLLDPLTRKEIEVLKVVAEGLSNQAVADKLFVSEATVRTHLRNINVKLGVHSRVQAIAAARRSGVIS